MEWSWMDPWIIKKYRLIITTNMEKSTYLRTIYAVKSSGESKGKFAISENEINLGLTCTTG